MPKMAGLPKLLSTIKGTPLDVHIAYFLYNRILKISLSDAYANESGHRQRSIGSSV